MGVCSNSKLIQNCILCNYPPKDNNIIIINLDKKDDAKNKNNNFDNKNEINNNYQQDYLKENLYNQHLNSKNQNDNNIIVYKIKSKFKSKALISSINSSNNLKIKDSKRSDNKNKYKLANERIEKLIHFTNSNNNVSIATNSILK